MTTSAADLRNMTVAAAKRLDRADDGRIREGQIAREMALQFAVPRHLRWDDPSDVLREAGAFADYLASSVSGTADVRRDALAHAVTIGGGTGQVLTIAQAIESFILSGVQGRELRICSSEAA